MSALSRLYNHMRWADQRALASLREMMEPPPQAVDLFAHMLAAEHVWLRRIQGLSPTYEVWPKLQLDECERLAGANYAGYMEVIAASDDSALGANVRYTNTKGQQFDSALEDILLHVTHHGMYHRGQIALLVRASGGNPQSTDFVFFTRGS